MPDEIELPEGISIAELKRLREDYPYAASRVLRVKTEEGRLAPFVLRKAQIKLHEAIEDQKRRTGRVRKIIVKARQLGSSTYVQGRFYWLQWKSVDPLKSYILTHQQPATDNIFGMAKRFYDEHPPLLAKPTLGASNAKELRFADNDCSYSVATAGTSAAGRSATLQLFHGSEVAFWPNAEDHVDGVMQAIGPVRGTEIILESTAEGISNLFYRYAMAALSGDSEFEVVFMPWYWDDKYRTPCPDTFNPSHEWLEWADRIRRVQGVPLDWDQLYWAWLKNREQATAISASFDRPCWKFMQEYPSTFDEAFQTSGDSFIPAVSVFRARKPEVEILGSGPIILGIDPARTGDRVGIIDRCGRRAGQRIMQRMEPPGNTVTLAAMIARIIDRILPDAVNIDMGSTGAALYDILLDLGYGYCLNAVNFGGNPVTTGPTGDDIYFNRRAEMYDLARQWFETEGGVMIPDDDILQRDLCAPMVGPGATRWNTSNELIIEEKDSIKKRLGASPDLGDAFVLTFAVPFAKGHVAQHQPAPDRSRRTRRSRTGY
jgi:hypothetical protein